MTSHGHCRSGEEEDAMSLRCEPGTGDEAPDFCLEAATLSNGKREKKKVCLHDYRGKQPVVLEFFGAAFTPT